jgi:hypothetical protein
MLKKIIFGFACVFVVVLIGVSIYQNKQLKKISTIPNSGSNINSESHNNATEPKGTIEIVSQVLQRNELKTDDVDSLKKQLDSTEKELDIANKKLSDEVTKKAELKKKEIELQKQFMKDPSYKNSMKTYLDMQYADIFKELNLSPEKLDKLKDLIVEFQTAFSEVNLDAYSANTDEEKAALRKKADSIYNDNQSKLKELLGDADYQKYFDYKERYYAINNASGFMNSLGQDEQITDDQKKQLIEIMYKEEKKVYSEIGYDPNKTLEFSSDVKSGKAAGRSKNMEKIFTASVEDAKAILTSSQLEKFKNYLTDYREKMDLSYMSSGLGE